MNPSGFVDILLKSMVSGKAEDDSGLCRRGIRQNSGGPCPPLILGDAESMPFPSSLQDLWRAGACSRFVFKSSTTPTNIWLSPFSQALRCPRWTSVSYSCLGGCRPRFAGVSALSACGETSELTRKIRTIIDLIRSLLVVAAIRPSSSNNSMLHYERFLPAWPSAPCPYGWR